MAKGKTLSLGSAAKIAPAATVTEPARILPDQTDTVGPEAPALPITAVPGGHWASTTAAQIAEDEKFAADMQEAWKAEETSKKKTAQVLFDLKLIFDDEELDKFPQLEPLLKDVPPGANVFIDQYETTKKDKDGKDKKGTGSRYVDLAHNLPWVKVAQTNYEYFRDAKKDRTKAKQEHIGWSDARFDTEIEKHRQRVRNSITMLRDAMRIHFQMTRINRMPLVGCALQTITVDRAGVQVSELLPAASPITIFSKSEKDKDTGQLLNCALSTGSFLQLNVDKAIEKGGTYSALIASAGRETKGPATQEPRIKDMDTLEGSLAELWAFLSQDHNAARLRSLIAGKTKKGEPMMSDDYVISIARAHIVLESIVTMPEFAGRAAALLQAKTNAEFAKRQAEIAAEKAA